MLMQLEIILLVKTLMTKQHSLFRKFENYAGVHYFANDFERNCVLRRWESETQIINLNVDKVN